MKMVVSHRESTISSNIRAIIEQLNLNPVERRRLIESRVDEIDRSFNNTKLQLQQQVEASRPRVTIGVYGIRHQVEEKLQSCRSVLIEQQQQQQLRQRKIARRVESRPRQRIPPRIEIDEVPRKDAPTPTNTSTIEPPPSSPLKEDLPELTTGQLNHTAALHRISVRPKNRRPPRRSTSQSSNLGLSNGLPRIDSISENSIDTMDSLEPTSDSSNIIQDITPPTTPQEVTKPIPILRKSSSRLSRNSDVFEELEAKLRKPAVSPDSLESNLDSRTDVIDIADEVVKISALPKPSPRTASVSSDGSRRRSSSNRLSKSPDSLESNSPGWLTDGFDFEKDNNNSRPVPARRMLLSKSQDSLEALNSFEIRRRKIMSKSHECFDEQLPEEKPKRASVSEMNLTRGGNYSKLLITKSTESFEKKDEGLDLDDKLENRNNSRRKRMQKSSESSELGSSDTLDSERRNTTKSSDSDETLDSLEKDDDNDDSAYWKRRSDSKENLDIHQLLAYTLVSKIQENGNNTQQTIVDEKPKKKQQQSSSEDTKTLNNLLSNKTDEYLQNMLNGNISEVSTDTKSFREKLNMFEKLGK